MGVQRSLMLGRNPARGAFGIKLACREEFIAPVARLLLKMDDRFAGLAIMPEKEEGRMPWSARQIAAIQAALLQWFRSHARDLPWRRTRDPYAVFVSEVMLQQTQAATVVPYFGRWMKRFPTWQALAEAPLEGVLKAWEGLGYYHRARNLHRAAKEVCGKHGGKLPADYYKVLSLPGVGRYTVGAICSIAFGMRLPVLDGNVVRVLARLANFRAPVDTSAAQKRLWAWAEALTPERHPGDFNQSLMELGALVCARSKPACLLCPVRTFCRAEDPGSLPAKVRRVALAPLIEDVEIVIRRGRVLVCCDPAAPRWPGLWQFPRTRATGPGEPWHSLAFAFTRFRGQMRAWLRPVRRAGAHERWVSARELATAPMPAPHRKLASRVEGLLVGRGPDLARPFA
mgnify:CR=1 FL=1